ncbi:MAG: hypothetical protein ABIG10_04185 [bacterium]
MAIVDQKKNEQEQLDQEIKQLVMARLKALPEGIEVSIGSDGSFNKEELIKSVEADDEIGKKMIEVDMQSLQALKEGDFYV